MAVETRSTSVFGSAPKRSDGTLVRELSVIESTAQAGPVVDLGSIRETDLRSFKLGGSDRRARILMVLGRDLGITCVPSERARLAKHRRQLVKESPI